jgi:hypothetical protein
MVGRRPRDEFDAKARSDEGLEEISGVSTYLRSKIPIVSWQSWRFWREILVRKTRSAGYIRRRV